MAKADEINELETEELGMDVFAGVAMGWVNETWAARLIAPLFWGAFSAWWTISRWLIATYYDRHSFMPERMRLGEIPKLASVAAARAIFISLPFSVLSGFISAWF